MQTNEDKKFNNNIKYKFHYFNFPIRNFDFIFILQLH